MLRPNMKMSELVESDFHLLSVVSRVGINGSFGEKTVDELCSENGLDTDTFILLCDIYASEEFRPTEQQLRRSHISDVMRYLHQSHDYYLTDALVEMRAALKNLTEPCSDRQKAVIRGFYEDYRSELEKHFEYEEHSIIPYVQQLLIGQRVPGMSISSFEENHSNMQETLSDLMSLIMKSLPEECDSRSRFSVLNFLFHLQHDLRRHTSVEDRVFVPMVQLLEDPRRKLSDRRSASSKILDGTSDELSEREKEILISVAEGLLNKEIADRHNISINTVITHRKNITRKTGIKTVAGLTVYAILNDLIRPSGK
jgi:Response regulator containing a CheY-like receiver domain and an HTH DNA-binding domain